MSEAEKGTIKELGITIATQETWPKDAPNGIKTRAPRTARPIFVEKWVETEVPAGSWKHTIAVATVTEAEKWLKKEGEAGATYRIITVEREVRLVVESKRVVSFA